MASKFKPGIPENFSLNVEPVNDLGDYLDERVPVPRPKTPRAPKAPEEAAVRPPVRTAPAESTPPSIPIATISPPPRQEAPAAAALGADRGEPTAADRTTRPKALRREISMTPETLRMSEELLSMIRSGSGQRDTAPNEMFHALVLLVYEVCEELELHTIPKRGRWGSPTARAYPVELKNAFLRALLRKYAQTSEAPSGLQYPVNTAA